jgi:hypothetical protein
MNSTTPQGGTLATAVNKLAEFVLEAFRRDPEGYLERARQRARNEIFAKLDADFEAELEMEDESEFRTRVAALHGCAPEEVVPTGRDTKEEA